MSAAVRDRSAPARRGLVDGASPRSATWLRRHGRRCCAAMQWAVVGRLSRADHRPALLPLPDRARISGRTSRCSRSSPSGACGGRSCCSAWCLSGAPGAGCSARRSADGVREPPGQGHALPHWITGRAGRSSPSPDDDLRPAGQRLSISRAGLLILGGSTAAASSSATVWPQQTRLVPLSLPGHRRFRLLTKLAPLHFRVDHAAWSASPQAASGRSPVNCAPLVPIKTMQGASLCHMCGRCSGYRGAMRCRAARRTTRSCASPRTIRSLGKPR